MIRNMYGTILAASTDGTMYGLVNELIRQTGMAAPEPLLLPADQLNVGRPLP